MSPGPISERVYLAVRQRICDGFYHPGERIDLVRLTQELSASASPIRDALHRLEGERLVESNAPSGFRTLLWTEPDLGDAYRWSADLLLLVVSSSKPEIVRAECASLDLKVGNAAEVTAELFGRLARATGNVEHRRAVASLSTRLHSVRLVEATLFPGAIDELSEVLRTSQAGQIRALKRQIAQYHRLRNRYVPQILKLMRPESD